MMKNLRREYFSNIEDDIYASSIDMKRANEYIGRSTATFTRGILSMMAIPKMHTIESFDIIKTAIEKTHAILDKIIERYLHDIKLQKLFPFDERLKKLILLKKQYKQNLPICRLDIFFDEDKFNFKFCEFNADGASAMNEDREIYNAWKDSGLYNKMRTNYDIINFELFDSWVVEFISLYTEYANNKKLTGVKLKKPTIAIVDFLDIGTKSEFSVFKEAFIKAGYNCVIEDITTLKYANGILYNDEGLPIDAVYRRAVTSECMDKYDSIKDFINAVIDDNVCVVGAFRTQVIHDKNLFRLFRDPYVKEILSYDENIFIEQHIPKTYLLNTNDYQKDEVLNNKNKYIIKPSDRYGSFDVHTGGDYTDFQWYQIISNYENKGFILQEYCPPYRERDLYFDGENPIYGDYGYMTGAFVYNGHLKGLYTRCMLNRTTTQKDEGRVTCTLVLKKRISI